MSGFARVLPFAAAALLVGGLAGCKVPLTDIAARFVVADAAWFAEEETLFVFYEVEAEQGLSVETTVELRYVTDDGVVDWTELGDIEPVHTHVPVDCGPNTRCGSTSIHVPLEPRDVEVRMRYHRDGALTLDPETRLNVIGPGPAHSNRSLLVYGVFDEDNRGVQWRARHLFPTLRNMEVERLGLRRRFTVDLISRAGAAPEPNGNAYLYGVRCEDPVALDWQTVETEDRAIFSPEELPESAFAAETVCARATVYDPTGPFAASAVARKNPEVRPAFPLLRSPIKEATPIKYFLRVCDRTISGPHAEMQQQRLLMEGIAAICIDAWADPDRVDAEVDAFVARVRDDLEAVRAAGRDMVIALAIHHDDPAVFAAALEQTLAEIITPELARNTPRLVGGFVFDSFEYTLTDATVGSTVLWCPALIDLDPDALEDGVLPIPTTGLSSLVCALPAEDLRLSLGPFNLGALPILPSRAKYLSFLDIYTADEAGRMNSLTFLAPELPPNADSLSLPPFGSVTFFNDEQISAEADDAFSYCETQGEATTVVFRSGAVPIFLPVAALPDWHAALQEESYGLGLTWEFPYLLELNYEAVAALAVSAFGASLPLGLGTDVDQDYGSAVWKTGEFPLARSLTQCRRYCGHPTFDAAGVYQIEDLFSVAYRTVCYTPAFPARGDDGFPYDP